MELTCDLKYWFYYRISKQKAQNLERLYPVKTSRVMEEENESACSQIFGLYAKSVKYIDI